ncbi:uncharacterized protein At4g00950 isoform X2 [Euphorbia lathyris]|uniref:uncharacterized protein At4g00950 isoform X2 n=1 Tax=Euphorbia lathyris TaxID=212925 RepID=UPI0033140959
MGSETESTPRLQLFCNTNTHALINSPPRSGTLTPPFYSSAAVPFRWEEEPGKPRGGGSTSFNALSNPQIDFTPKSLELPPRLLLLDHGNGSKLNSPTTVLDGPYMVKPRFQSSSFRIIRKECYGSFGRRSYSPEREELSALVVSRRFKDRSFLGSWRWGRGNKREIVGPSYVFPNSSIDKELEDSNPEEEEEISCNINVKLTRIRPSGSVSSYTRLVFMGA